jgi:hypothetical protein
MPIKFKCPSCDQMLGIARRKAGSVISCPRCSYPATVPQNEGEVARPAAAGRASGQPHFERGDFDRWIGGRPRPSGSSGGVAMMEAPSTAPAAFAPATLSDTHTGLLDAHRQRVQQQSAAPVIDVRLGVALILGASLAAFGGGWYFGHKSAVTKATGGMVPLAANNAKQPASNAPAAPPAAGDSKFVLSGQVNARTKGAVIPDAGARIIVFPTGQKPLKKIPAGGLRPGEESGPDQAGMEAITKIGGAATTADIQGHYSIPLPKEGRYWVLVISKNATRTGPLMLQVEEQSLHQYFADIGEVVGNKDFSLVPRRAFTGDDGKPAPPQSYSPEFRGSQK